jgi:undecaprenyl-diphosphatase
VNSYLTSIVLGLIEGVTEFLPVSSTGHLQLAERWLTPQSELFDIIVQCGAVLAVLAVFQGRIRRLAVDFRQPPARDYLAKLLLAFLITIVGVLISEKVGLKARKEDVEAAAWTARIAWATLIGGVLFLITEAWLRGRQVTSEITWTVAVAVGVAQIVAANFSGTSRSGATILFALALGVARPAATEFSFLVGVPTLLAAGGYKLLKAWKHHELGTENWGAVLLATAVAAITAFMVIRWLLRFVQNHTFVVFGWYRIVLGLLLLLLPRFSR